MDAYYNHFKINNEFDPDKSNVCVQYNFPAWNDIDFYNAEPEHDDVDPECIKRIIAKFTIKLKTA